MSGSEGKETKARSRKRPPAPKRPRDKQHLDELLDEALEGTFPASDPIALTSDRE